MTPVAENKQLFINQAVALETAHAQGSEAFESATQSVFGFIVEYPGRVLEQGAEHTDSQLAVAYEVALTGLHSAITDERLRRDFAQTIVTRLNPIKTEPPEQEISTVRLDHRKRSLLIEALHNSFPDEVGMLSDELDVSSFISNQEQPELDTTNIGKFERLIADLISQAKSMQEVIEAANTDSCILEVHEGSPDKKLTLLRGRKKIVIGRDDGGTYFVERTTEDGKGKKKEVRRIRVKPMNSLQTPAARRDTSLPPKQKLGGSLKITQGKNKPVTKPLKRKQTIRVAENILARMQEELIKRYYAYSPETAQDEEIDNMLEE